jgi:hypothetical protein
MFVSVLLEVRVDDSAAHRDPSVGMHLDSGLVAGRLLTPRHATPCGGQRDRREDSKCWSHCCLRVSSGHGIRTSIRRHAGLSGTVGAAIDQAGLRAVAGA